MKNSLSHIAFIMDGNNRWSKKNNFSLFESYRIGAENLLSLCDYLFSKKKISQVSAFALSTNNLKRSKKIINNINKVLLYFIDKLLTKNDFSYNIKIYGDTSVFPKPVILKLKQLERNNSNYNKTLNIFLNFGGQEEIIDIIKFYKKNNFSKIDLYKQYYKYRYNPPEILIRTGGFQRLSNFMLYQLAFTELFFVKKLWPDLRINDLNKLINQFNEIHRKFGK